MKKLKCLALLSLIGIILSGCFAQQQDKVWKEDKCFKVIDLGEYIVHNS